LEAATDVLIPLPARPNTRLTCTMVGRSAGLHPCRRRLTINVAEFGSDRRIPPSGEQYRIRSKMFYRSRPDPKYMVSSDVKNWKTGCVMIGCGTRSLGPKPNICEWAYTCDPNDITDNTASRDTAVVVALAIHHRRPALCDLESNI
jgi:hypothetical protein